MSVLVACNSWLADKISADYAYVQAPGRKLHLFQNDYHPNPASIRINFTECIFSGYGAQTLSGQFNAPYKVEDGMYQVNSIQLVWTVHVHVRQKAYGWWVDDLNGNVMCAARYDTPYDLFTVPSVRAIVALQEVALVIACP